MKTAVAALATALAAVLLGGCASEPTERPPEAAAVACDIDAGPCRGSAGAVTVTLEITPRPVRTMTDLTFRVTASTETVPVTDEAVAVELTMPGMSMGENRIILSPRGQGSYEGRGVIVRCPSGGRGWRATVFSPSVPHLGFDLEVDAP